MAHPVFTWITPIRDDRAEALDRLLLRIGVEASTPEAPQPLIPFHRLPMLHFASLTVFEPPGEPRLLVFEHNIDERRRGVDEYVTLLVDEAGPALAAIYACCVGGEEAIAAASLRTYLKEHTHYPQLYHLGHPGRSLAAIEGDQVLRRALAHVVDREQPPRRLATELLAAARRRLNIPPSASRWWEPVPIPRAANAPRLLRWVPEPPFFRLKHRAALAVGLALVAISVLVLFDWLLKQGRDQWTYAAAALLVLLVALHKSDGRLRLAVLWGAITAAVVPAILWIVGRFDFPSWLIVVLAAPLAVIVLLASAYAYVGLRMVLGDERPEPPPEGRVRVLEQREGQRTQNHIAGLTILRGPLKRLRILRLRLSLWVLFYWFRGVFGSGKLERIPSIHCGHWTVFDDKLLFLVNYDGGWDTYLDDFFRSLAGGVAFIWYDTLWGNSRNFPRTFDPLRLKTWVRQTQVAERAWYVAAAYQGQTVAAINNNTDLRRMLLGPRFWQLRLRTKMRTWPRRLAVIGD